MKSDYRWDVKWWPSPVEGQVFKGDRCLVSLAVQDKDDRLLVARLAGITRLLASVDRKLGK